MRKLRHFLKVEVDQYSNIEIEWKGGHIPTAYFLDEDGEAIQEVRLPDEAHAKLIEWFKTFDFVPEYKAPQWPDEPDQVHDWNEHHYEFFNVPARYEEAAAFAATRYHNGKQGYPVVITTDSEYHFLYKNFLDGTWLGADETEDTWTWGFGPEKGELFYQGGDVMEKHGFSKFRPPNPDNKDGVQHCLVQTGLWWTDESCLSRFPIMIEFGDDLQPDPRTQHSRSKRVNTKTKTTHDEL